MLCYCISQYDPSRSPGTPVSTKRSNERLGAIPLQTAATLADLVRERVRRGPGDLAYLQYDAHGEAWQDWSRAETGLQDARWRAALKSEDVQAGDQVAKILRRNHILVHRAAEVERLYEEHE